MVSLLQWLDNDEVKQTMIYKIQMHACYFINMQHNIITVNNETNMEKIFKVSEWSPSIRTVHESKRHFRGQGLQAAIEETPALFVSPSYKHCTLSCVS